MSDQIMFKRLEAYEFAIAEYEKALQSAFPEGATGDVFRHRNAAYAEIVDLLKGKVDR